MPRPRRPSKLRPFKTLKIFCEGQKTEPNYLRGYIASLDSDARKSVVEVEPTRKNTAVQLVEEAIKAKKAPEALPDDEFWVVYDREAPAKYSDELHAKALGKADSTGVNVALCNVCFEYWLLLHFVDTDAPYQSFDDLLKRSVLNEQIRKSCGNAYDKSSSTIFNTVANRVADARVRGSRLNKRGLASAPSGKDKAYQINPYVGIVELMDAIDSFV